MKSEMLSAGGKLWEVAKALVQAVQDAGGSDEDVRRIETDSELRKKIGELVVGAKPADSVTFDFDPSKPFARDMRKEGWTLVSDAEHQSGSVTLELCEFLKSGESWIRGEEMAKRAIKLGADFGQKHAEALLECQDRIPKEWRGKYYLTFPGTIWRDSCGDRSVAFLSWDGRRWCLLFDWLEDGWRGYDRFLRPRK